MKRYCLTCDLKDDPELIHIYKKYHSKGNVWNEVLESIRESGVLNMEIYLVASRMFMIIETKDDFSLDKKARLDAQNAKVGEWENLMNKFQKIPEFSPNGEKWVLMDKIFDLKQHY